MGYLRTCAGTAVHIYGDIRHTFLGVKPPYAVLDDHKDIAPLLDRNVRKALIVFWRCNDYLMVSVGWLAVQWFVTVACSGVSDNYRFFTLKYPHRPVIYYVVLAVRKTLEHALLDHDCMDCR